MQLRNSRGTPVDPVPFLVVAATAFTVSYSYGPLYLMALGMELAPALLACGVVVAGSTAAAYHRYVWRARPDLRGEVPAGVRLRRFFYGVLVGVALLAALALPLFAR